MALGTVEDVAATAIPLKATIMMPNAIGPRFQGGLAMWETKETLEGGLRIDRWWWVLVKVGAVVAVSVPISLGMALAFL